MKRPIPTISILSALLLAGTTLCSCNEAQRLASELQGSWSSAPEVFINDQSSQATIIESISFLPDSSGTSGTVLIDAMISSTGYIAGNNALVQPFEMTASAKANVKGSWHATGHEELQLSLDIPHMQVSVDPDALVITTNLLTGGDQSTIQNLKPHLAKAFQSVITRALTSRYTDYSQLDDVKVSDHDNMLKFETRSDHDRLYHRQGPAPEAE